jgi:hypothetical protein
MSVLTILNNVALDIALVKGQVSYKGLPSSVDYQPFPPLHKSVDRRLLPGYPKCLSAFTERTLYSNDTLLYCNPCFYQSVFTSNFPITHHSQFTIYDLPFTSITTGALA